MSIYEAFAETIEMEVGFEQFVDDAPTLGIAGKDLANLFVRRAHHRAGRDNFRGAIDDLLHAIQLDGSSSPAYEALGMAYSSPEIGKYKKAVKNFSQAIKLSPTPSSYTGRAVARLCCTEKPDQVMADIDHALRLDPQYGPAQEVLKYIREHTSQESK